MSVKVCSGCGAASDRKLCNVCRSEGKRCVPQGGRRKRASTTRLASAPDSFPSYQRERERAAAIRAEDPAGWEQALPLRGVDPSHPKLQPPTVGEWLEEKRAAERAGGLRDAIEAEA